MKSLIAADRPYDYIFLDESITFLQDSSRERKLLHQVGCFVQSWVGRNNKRSNKMRRNLSGRVLLLLFSWFFCLSFEGQCSESYMLLLFLKRRKSKGYSKNAYSIVFHGIIDHGLKVNTCIMYSPILPKELETVIWNWTLEKLQTCLFKYISCCISMSPPQYPCFVSPGSEVDDILGTRAMHIP